jgi:hypothetical protein
MLAIVFGNSLLLCSADFLSWSATKFASNRQIVIDKLQENSYPRPNGKGSVINGWTANGGADVLSWIDERTPGADASIATGPIVQSASGMEHRRELEDVKLRKGVIHKGVLHKLNPKRQQRKLRTFEVVQTTAGGVELRCSEGPKKKGRASAAGSEHPNAVWQLNWTSTEALAVSQVASGDQKKKKSSRKSSTARAKGAKGWSFSVAGLLSSKSMRPEQLLLEAPAQDDAARWMDTINGTMQESMARELGRKVVCGLKVLRIHMEGASMEVSAVWFIMEVSAV